MANAAERRRFGALRSQAGGVVPRGLPDDSDHLEKSGTRLRCYRNAPVSGSVHGEDQLPVDLLLGGFVIPFLRSAGRTGGRRPSGGTRTPSVSASPARARFLGFLPSRNAAARASRRVLRSAHPIVPATGAAASVRTVAYWRHPRSLIETASAERTPALNGRFRDPMLLRQCRHGRRDLPL